MNMRFADAACLALSLLVVSNAGAQAPIGYERFTDPYASSGVAFGLTSAQVFNSYADPFPTFGLSPRPRKDLRLIDIEIRPDEKDPQSFVYDVATVSALLLTPDQYPGIMGAGYQIVDQENSGWGHTITIWVNSGNPFLPFYDQTEAETIFHHGHTGRVIDLEVALPPQTPVLYDTINLP